MGISYEQALEQGAKPIQVKKPKQQLQTRPPEEQEDDGSFLGSVAEFLAPTATESFEKWQEGEDVSTREKIGSALEIGSYFVPVGAVARGIGLAGKGALTLGRKLGLGALGGAMEGGMFEAGRAIGDEETSPLEITERTLRGVGLGTAFGTAIPGGVAVAKNIPRAVRATAPVAQKVAQKGVDITRKGVKRAPAFGKKAYGGGKIFVKGSYERAGRVPVRVAEMITEKEKMTQRLAEAPSHIKQALKHGIEDGDIILATVGSKADNKAKVDMIEIAKKSKENPFYFQQAKKIPGATIAEGPAKYLITTMNRGVTKTKQVLGQLGKGKQNVRHIYDTFIQDMKDSGVQIFKGRLISTRGSKIPDADLKFYNQVLRDIRPTKSGNVPLTYKQMHQLRQKWFDIAKTDQTFTGGTSSYAKRLRSLFTQEIDTAANGKYFKAQNQIREAIGALKSFAKIMGYKGDIKDITTKDLKAGEVFSRIFGNAADRPNDVLDGLYNMAKRYGYKGTEDARIQLKFADRLEDIYVHSQSRSLRGQVGRGTVGTDPQTDPLSLGREAAKWSVYAAAMRLIRNLSGIRPEDAIKAFEDMVRVQAGYKPLTNFGKAKTIGQAVKETAEEVTNFGKKKVGSIPNRPLNPGEIQTKAFEFDSAEKFTEAFDAYPEGLHKPGTMPAHGTAKVEDIVPDIGELSTEELLENPESVRDIAKIMKRIKEGGKIDPILVRRHMDEDGVYHSIVDGSHRLAAYKELGKKKIPIFYEKSSLEDIWQRSTKTDNALIAKARKAQAKGQSFDEFVEAQMGKVETVKISELPERATAIGMGKAKYDKMAAEIKKYGIKNPIIINKASGAVIDGQHRAFVSQKLGIEEIPAIKINIDNFTLKEAQNLSNNFSKTKSKLKDIWNQENIISKGGISKQLSKGKESFGAFAGFEVDEEGNINFNPEKATIGLGLTAGFTSPKLRQQAMKEFKGFKDLTTKTLDKLKGKISVSKQFISDLSNQPDLKQPERDLIRGVLDEFKDDLGGEFPQLYHGSGSVSKIKREGFRRGGFPGHVYPDGIYFSTTKKEAELYGELIEAKTDLKLKDFFDISDNKKIKKTNDEVNLNKNINELIRKEAKKKGVKIPKLPKFKSDEYFDVTGEKITDPLYHSDIKEEVLGDMGYKGFIAPQKDGGKEIIIFDINDIEIGTKTINNKIPVDEFANKVKAELLPLERVNLQKAPKNYLYGQEPRYENISLPSEIRGDIANYTENIYKSPIKTSAGEVHFGRGSGDVENYFAHTRVEDLPSKEVIKAGRETITRENIERINRLTSMTAEQTPGDIRRVIELQSDLMQKGRLESERIDIHNITRPQFKSVMTLEDAKLYESSFEISNQNIPLSSSDVAENVKLPIRQARETIEKLEKKYTPKITGSRDVEIQKLQPYRNTWHERIIKEEVKKAAQDGKTKLRFPTGGTAMKIEGLSGEPVDMIDSSNIQEVRDYVKQNFIKTFDIGEYGKWDLIDTPQGRLVTFDVEEGIPFLGIPEDTFKNRSKILQREGVNTNAFYDDMLDYGESISAIKTNPEKNPIYKFYEKDVQKYLNKKYNAKRITDEQGVEWIEVDITPAMKNKPIEAFGGASIETIVGGATLSGAALLGAGLADKTMTDTINYEREEKPKQIRRPVKDLQSALRYVESRGEKNPYSFSKWSDPEAGPQSRYGKDLGAYQITSARLREKSEDFLGRQVTPEEFLKKPTLQDKFVEEQFKWLRSHGLTDEEMIAVHRHGWGHLTDEDIQEALEARREYVDTALGSLKNTKTNFGKK